jgi:hypothetical protein
MILLLLTSKRRKTMKKYWGILMALLLILPACKQQPSEETGKATMEEQESSMPASAVMEKGAELPAADGTDLMTYITETNPYENWQLFPGTSRLHEGMEPHGAYLTTFVNDKALEAIHSKTPMLPAGSIVVKENYTNDKKLAAVTAIYKISNFDPEVNDWYWLKYTPDGTIAAKGKVDGCISCHVRAKSSDWLFSYK